MRVFFCVLIILHGSVVCTNNIDTELILIVNFYFEGTLVNG